MKFRLLILVILINSNHLLSQNNSNKNSISTRIEKYLNSHEIKPRIILQNKNLDSLQSEIEVSQHKIKWIYNENNYETKLQIDDNLFSLKDKITLNETAENQKDSINFANNWDEIKFYKIGERELIGIRMSYYHCVGLGCSVDYYLFYDLKTKAKNFFGTFKTGNEMKLFDFGVNRIDFVSKTYIEIGYGVDKPISHLYQLFSLKENGEFEIQKDKNGKLYYLKRFFHTNNEKENRSKFQQNWFTKI
ncbi:MAG: hypothetical protein V4548_07640 [Bacteroidota bacterium]